MEAPPDLLLRARERLAAGEVDKAWSLVREVADHARATADTALLADAATTLHDLPAHTSESGQVHRLCVEALAALGDTDPARSRQVRDQRDATRSPWSTTPPAAHTGESSLLGLQAKHARLLHPDHIDRRLAVADRALALAAHSGSDESAAWGHLWRILALGQQGRRVALDADVADLAHAVARIDQPAWWSRLDLVRAGQRLLDGRFSDCAAAANRAGGYLGLVMRSQLALLTGDGLEDVETEVGHVLDGLPFLARGWHAQILLAQGRRDDAERLWRALAPHVLCLPQAVPEWLVTVAGHARIAVQLGDVETASLLYDQLVPHRDLHVLGAGDGPYGGPVALDLGRIAALRGDRDRAAEHLSDALASTERIHALPWVALTRLELAYLGSPGGYDHLRAAGDMADRLGMAPLAADAADLAAQRASTRRGPLSPRETEVAGYVAEGLSNRAIADRLHLSERTVENHVSHLLTKLALPSRAAVAAWITRNT